MNLDQTAVAGASININQSHQSSQFHIINVDCWKNIFDYFALRDIIAMSKTCSRMRQICGYYLREHYPELGCKLPPNPHMEYPNVMINDLSEFMSKVMIHGQWEHFLSAESYFSLKTLLLRQIEMSDRQINYIKDVLKYVEVLDFRGCTIYDDLHEKFLKYCPKLKQLIFEQNNFEPRPTFLEQNYPSLEYLVYIHCDYAETVNIELQTFLERNSNVKHLGIEMYQLWMNRKSFIKSNIRLDCLEVYSSFDWYLIASKTPIPTFVNYLESLRKCGFYKTLHFSIMYSDEEDRFQALINEMATLKELEVMRINQDIDLSGLVHLKELCLWVEAINIELLAKNLVHLERLFFFEATADDILPFFRYSTRLKTVKVFALICCDGLVIKYGALDLFALNEERRRLGSRIRVTICVMEEIYLNTKKKKMNFNLDWVEIARGDSESLGSYERCGVDLNRRYAAKGSS